LYCPQAHTLNSGTAQNLPERPRPMLLRHLFSGATVRPGRVNPCPSVRPHSMHAHHTTTRITVDRCLFVVLAQRHWLPYNSRLNALINVPGLCFFDTAFPRCGYGRPGSAFKRSGAREEAMQSFENTFYVASCNLHQGYPASMLCVLVIDTCHSSSCKARICYWQYPRSRPWRRRKATDMKNKQALPF
jgi:hypothetical protein